MTISLPPLVCVCGRPAEPPCLTNHPWAQYVGYGDHNVVQFCTTQDQASDESNYPALLETRPGVGDKGWLRLSHPFVASERTFWCLYQSPMMIWNGPEHGGPELSQMALVRCQIVSLVECKDDRGELRLAAGVDILAVVTLQDLVDGPQAPFPVSGDEARKLIQDDACLDRLEPTVWQGDYAYIAATEFETDWGQWAILYRSGDEIELLAMGQWGYHYDHFWAGRVRLTALPEYLQTHLSRQPILLPVQDEAPNTPSEKPKPKWLDIRFQWPKGRW